MKTELERLESELKDCYESITYNRRQGLKAQIETAKKMQQAEHDRVQKLKKFIGMNCIGCTQTSARGMQKLYKRIKEIWSLK